MPAILATTWSAIDVLPRSPAGATFLEASASATALLFAPSVPVVPDWLVAVPVAAFSAMTLLFPHSRPMWTVRRRVPTTSNARADLSTRRPAVTETGAVTAGSLTRFLIAPV
ncbi:Uncharacterised protein [Mycobacteroides abscessus subsp. abscessus]|nr:Uncharacterised protein [Mycobacteroides abscessus subsp. abscessus]